MTDHEGDQIVSITSAINYCEEGCVRRAIDSHRVERADAEERAESESLKHDPDVISHNANGKHLVGVVHALPPMWFGGADNVAGNRGHSG